MLSRLRYVVACLVVAAPVFGAHAEEKLSRLEGVQVDPEASPVLVLIRGTRAPDFTSFTMQDPFRVVVDWAGSELDAQRGEESFERGLVRRIQTRQFSSEAEKISRVILELAQKTTYRVQAKGTTVRVFLDPVPDPLPAPEPVIEPDPQPVAEAPVVPIVDGPLTEPDVPIPSAPVAVAAAAAPTPKPVTVPVVDDEPAAAAVAVVEDTTTPPVPTPSPAPAPVVVAAVPVPVPVPEPAPVPAPEPEVTPEPEPEPVVVAEAPKPAPAPEPAPIVAPEPEPVEEPEPVRLATFTPEVEPERTPRHEEVAPAAPVVTSPPAAPATTRETRTQQIASAMPPAAPPAAPAWQPPGAAAKRRNLEVVKIAAPQEPLQPESSMPADPDQPRSERPAPTMPVSADASDFDPGPRVLKYIGFRQMAQVSRIFVRMDGKARYRQFRDGDMIVIELIDTSVPIKNNTRALDTSYFNTPVLRVQAVPSGDNTRVEVKLREQAGFEVKRIGTTIAVDFSRAP